MGALGVKGKEKSPNQGIRDHGAGFYDVSDKKISAQKERNRKEGVYTSKISPYNRPSLLIAEPQNKAEVL
ncbi:MAG: hypothetical protein NTY05_12995 [Rhodocyclales bacterium]|nr:hypothetical protein [Rhodocyclales bacterium]